MISLSGESQSMALRGSEKQTIAAMKKKDVAKVSQPRLVCKDCDFQRSYGQVRIS